MPLSSRILAAVNLDFLVILAAFGDVAVKTEVVTPDELLILWCVIGGFCGSFCSLRFFQPKTPLEASSQFFVNLCLSSIISPLLVDQAARWTGFPLGLRLALPISLFVGILGCQTVGLAIPYAEQWFRARGRRVVREADQ